MKHIFNLIVFIMILNAVYGQIHITENRISGIDKFKLGDTVVKFSNDIQPLTSPLSKGCESYQYLPSLHDSITIGKVNFKIILLDFDDSGRLVTIYINKFFQHSDFIKQSKKEYKEMLAYIKSVLHQNGEKKEYYKGIYIGYEWEKEDTKIKVDFQQTNDVSSTSIGVTLTLRK